MTTTNNVVDRANTAIIEML